MPKYEIDEGEEKWIKGVEVDRIFVAEVSPNDLEGKILVFFSIYGQPMENRGGYDLIEIQ